MISKNAGSTPAGSSTFGNDGKRFDSVKDLRKIKDAERRFR